MSILRKDLRTSTADGMAASLMVGIGETYFPAFVLALSGSQLACGLVTTVPLVAGALVQLISPRAVERWCSYRQWVVVCAAVQAAVFVPLIFAAAVGAMSMMTVFAVISLYWAAGMASGSSWNVWMGTLVPQQVRARYFAWRTRICQWGISIGFVVGGVVLHLAAHSQWHLQMFALLFVAAGVSRCASAWFLSRQREPLHSRNTASPQSAWRSFRSMLHGPNGRVILYLLTAQAGVQIAGPYFNPYMLGHLELSYCAYVILICTATMARILFLPAIGRVADRWGAHRLFWISAVAITPLPALWLVSDAFPYLIGVQLFAGAGWAASELSTLILFFETIPREKRVHVLTVFNLANAAATAAGSFVGGALLTTLGDSRQAYVAIFVLSTIGRAVAVGMFARGSAAAILRKLLALRPAFLARPAPVEVVSATVPSHLHGPHWSRIAAEKRAELETAGQRSA